VAAETPLSFLLDETPGAPARVTAEVGTKVQSVPGEGEKPQTFETIEALDARVAWNALTPILTTAPVITAGVTSLDLKGTSTNLQPGDAILLVGDERDRTGVGYPDKERWDFRVLLTVTSDVKNARTHVTWERGLGKAPIAPAAENVKAYAFRQRAALFGHNAPNPKLVTAPGGGAVGEWEDFRITGNALDLDAAYPKMVAGSWVALVNSADYVELYKAVTVSFPSRADFALSGKVTRIVPDTTEHFSLFGLRDTLVWGQNEPLELSSGPLLTPPPGSLSASLPRDLGLLAPLEGPVIRLDRLIPVLPGGRILIVTGKPLRARVAVVALTLLSADGQQSRGIKRGDSLVLTALPAVINADLVRWSLRTDDGFAGIVVANRTALILAAARGDDPMISQIAVVESCTGDPTILALEAPLSHLYDRETVSIAANVAEATHGETVSEVLGGGDAAQPGQEFALKQTPLTHLRSATAGGAASSLEVRVNDLLWREVASLFEHGPGERIYTTAVGDEGTVTVRFGDGRRGARLPSGPQNVKARYRRGIGLDGLVRAGQLSTLLTRPPGLKSAVNSLPAEGAAEPELLADARQNAPLTVLTLDRVVSLEDYENFSRAYAGIAKSLATWTWDGRTRGILLTVAGPRGAAVSAALTDELIRTIQRAGDPFVPLRVVSYLEAHFRLSGQVMIDPAYEAGNVIAAMAGSLRAAFSFEQRAFGQPVMLSEVIALAQAIPGVVAVNIRKLHRSGAPVKLNVRLEAALPAGSDPASLSAAELLTIDPAPIELEVTP
jgi:hypothetical protein